MSEERVRIFVSSPSDVAHERAAVKDVVARLGQEYLPYFRLTAVLWEEEALTADRSFQAGLTQPEDCDIVLVILWTRLGSPLPEEPYRGMTGTEWEFVNAVEASARKGSPEVLVYKKTAPKLVDITEAESAQEAIEDRRRLETFFQGNFFNQDNTFRRAFRTFDNAASFRELVEVQLRKLLNRRISAERRAAAGALQWHGSPFRPDQPFDIGDERVFTGREAEVRALLAQLSSRRPGQPGFLLLSGASGSGKTSLLRAGLAPRLTRPFLFEQIALVRCALVHPGSDGPTPLAALASRLTAADMLAEPLAQFGLGRAQLERLLASEPKVAANQLASALAQVAKVSDGEARAWLVLVIDPLEALFHYHDAAHQQTFAATLRGLAAHADIWVIAALRGDALHRLAELPALAELPVAGAWTDLEPPATARIRQIIEIPTRIAGLELESSGDHTGHGLVEQIEAEAARLRFWAAPVQGLLEEAYRNALQSAGMPRLSVARPHTGNAIARQLLDRADALWHTLDADARAGLPRLCRALIGIDGPIDTGAIPRHGDLRILRSDPNCTRLLEAMIEARLIVAEGTQDAASLKPCEAPDYRILSLIRDAWHQGRWYWLQRWWWRWARRRGQDNDSDDLAPPAERLPQSDAGKGKDPADEERAQRIRSSGQTPELADKPSTSLPTNLPVKLPAESAMAAAEPDDPDSDTRPQAIDWRDYLPVASFSHPILISDWAPICHWLQQPEHRQLLHLRSRLTRQARLWRRTDCNRDYLYRESGYAAAQELVRACGDELEPIERDFLDQSAAHLSFLRRRNRFVRGVGLMLILLLLAVTAAAVLALQASHEARVNLHRSKLKEAYLHISLGNTPQAVSEAIAAGEDLPLQAVQTLSRAFGNNRLLAMERSAGPSLGQPRIPGFNADGTLLATIVPGIGPRLWRKVHGRFVADRDLQAEGLGLHSLVIGDDEQLFGIGERGIWRLPAAADALPLYDCGSAAGATFLLDAARRYLAVAHNRGEQYGVCIVNLSLPGRVVFQQLFDEGEIRGLDFSPEGDLLLTASTLGRTHLIDLTTAEIRLSLPAAEALGRPFNHAVFDSTAERIAIAAVDERVRLYRVDGTPIGELANTTIGGRNYKIHRSAVRDVAFAPDGEFLVAVDDEGQVVRWSLDGSNQAVVLGNHQLSISDVEIAPKRTSDLSDETLVLSASLDKTARLWGLETGKAVAVLGHDGALSTSRFSRDARRVFTFSERDGSVRLWSIEPVSNLAYLLRHPDHVWNLDLVAAPPELAPDGNALLLATAGFDGGVRVWRYDRGRQQAAPELLAMFQEHTSRVRQASFSASGRLLVSAGYDGKVHVHDLISNDACKLQIETDSGGEQVYNALFGPPATAHTEGGSSIPTVAGQDLKTRQQSSVQPGIGSAATPSWLLTTSDDTTQPVRLFSLRHCAPMPTGEALRHGSVAVKSAALRNLTDRTLVSTGDEAGILRLLERNAAGDWSERCELNAGVGAIGNMVISADGSLIGVAGSSERAALIAIDDKQCGAPLYLIGHTERLYSIDITPDGTQILTSSLDKTARVWTRDGEPRAVLTGHQDRIYRAIFSPGDARWILSASRDGSMRLWRTPQAGAPRSAADGVESLSAFLPLKADLGGVANAAFSPDGHLIAGAYWENAAQLWRIWSEDESAPPERIQRWGEDRARLALIGEAYRFQANNQVDSDDAMAQAEMP